MGFLFFLEGRISQAWQEPWSSSPGSNTELSAGACGQSCKEGTARGRKSPEMPVSLSLEERRCHQSGVQTEDGKKGQAAWVKSLGISNAGHFRAEEIKPSHVERSRTWWLVSSLQARSHQGQMWAFICTGLCLSCLPLRGKQASKATRLAGALAAWPAGNTQLGYSYQDFIRTMGLPLVGIPPSLPSPLTLASFNFILRVSLLLTFPHVFPK